MTPRTKTGKNIRFAFKVSGLILRGFLLLFAFSLVLVLGIFFALPRLLSGAHAKEALASDLQNRFHRPVSIQALVATFSGLKIEDLMIGSSRPGGTPFLKARSVLIGLNLKHLLDKKIEVNDIRLINPMAHFKRADSGNWNFTSFFSSGMPSMNGLNAWGHIPISISIAPSGISIEDGSLQLDDHISSTNLTMSLLNANLKPLDFSRPFLLNLNFLSQGRFLNHDANLSLSFQGISDLASLDLNRAFIRAEKFRLSFSSYNVTGSWRLVDLKEPSLEAALKLPALGPTDWQSFFHRSWDFHLPASALNINVAMNGGQVQINRLDINAEPLLVGATGSLLISGALPQGNLFLIAHDFPLHAAVDFFPPLREYQLEGNVQAKASVSGNLQKPIIESASFEAENFKAKIFKSKLRSKKFLFNSSQNFQQLAMRASGAEIRTSSNTFSRLSGNIVLIKKKDLRVKALSFGWDGSVFHLKGRLFPLPKPRIVAVAGSINHLSSDQISDFISQIKSHRDLASPGKENKTIPLAVSWKKKWVKVFKTFIPKKFPNTMGRIHVGEIVQSDFYFKNVDLLWTLKGVTPSLNHINGEAGISLGPGQVKDIETLQSSHKLLKVIFLPYVYMHKMNSLSVLSAAEAYPKTLDFNRIEGEYGISRGIITTRFSYLTGPELVAYASGKADFAKEKIDMSVLTRLTHYRAPLPEWWVDELGRPAIGFRVTGDLNHPSVEPRLSKIKAGEIEGDVELGRKEEKSRLRALQRLNFL